MKYSSWIGFFAAAILVAACFMTWVTIPVYDKVLTGLNADGTTFGKPGKLHIYFAGIASLLFIIPRLWAKRLNMLICALAFSWALRNFVMYGKCELATCPVRQLGLYLVLFSSIVMLASALLSDYSLKPSQKK